MIEALEYEAVTLLDSLERGRMVAHFDFTPHPGGDLRTRPEINGAAGRFAVENRTER